MKLRSRRWLFLFLALFAAVLRGASKNAEEFRRELNQILNASPLRCGVAIKDLKSGEEFLARADESFPQGSSIRIHLLTELYRQAALGKVSLNDLRPVPPGARVGGFGVLRYMGQGAPVTLCLRDYAVLVATLNDNVAANVLTEVVGMEQVNAALVAQGTPEIKFRRRAMNRRDASSDHPENVATPRAVMRSLVLLHSGQVVNPETSHAIIDLLALPDQSYVRRDLPYSVRFAGISGSGPTFRCDEGIVLLGNRPYVLCVMIREFEAPRAGYHRDYSAPDELIGRISKLAFDYFREAKTDQTSGRVRDP